MRIFRSEFGHDYPSYCFGYTLHAELDPGEAPHLAYEAGYLPASANPEVHNRFYMARSIRVPLADFTPSSENRRVLKKFDTTFTSIPMSQDELQNHAPFKDCFLSYFADRHGQGVMHEKRLAGILATTLPLRGFRYEREGLPVAYVLEVAENGLAHYWFSCHDMSLAGTSLGMWLMLDAVRRAKEEGRTHLYLGTAYGEKGRYKMNIAPLEHWNGDAWDADMNHLKQRIKNDP